MLDRVLDFLAHEDERKLWRLDGDAMRRKVVRSAFHRLNLARPAAFETLHGVGADHIADWFETFLEETIILKPATFGVLDDLRRRGTVLGRLINGSSARQAGAV